jgi:Ca2+-binding EF-hand superfamily protein
MRGIRCLISLENNFRALDDDNSQTVDFDAFEKTAEDFRFGISFEELENLFYFFDKEKKGRIDYDEFVRTIRGQMSNSRKQLVEDIFGTFETDQDGFVHIKRLYQLFNPENHPDALTGKKSPEEVYKEFLDTFEGNHNYLNGDEAQFGNVDIDEFCDYYDSISMLLDKDIDFENMVKGVWLDEVNNQQEEKSQPLRAKKVLRYSDNQKPNEYDMESNDIKKDQYENGSENLIEKEDEKRRAVNEGFESFKKYLQQKDAKTVLTLARHFKNIDQNGNKTIDFGEFCRGMKNAGLNIPEDVLQELFNDFDYDGSGVISYDEFMVKLLGNLNPRREAVVRAAFNKLDLDKSGVVELNEVKSFYNTKNNPQVLNGEINEEQLYAHFMDTFGNHHNLYSGIRDKRVTWKEFLDYYRFMSFNIPDDDLFEAILVAAWRLENTGEYIKSQRDEDMKKQRMLEQAMGEKQESMRGRKNETSVRGGGAPFGVDREPTDYSTSNMNNINDNNQKLRGKKKSNYNEQMNVKDNLSENKSDIYNKEYGTDNSYRKPYQNQYKKGISTGEDALNTLKDVIRQRGSRGILGMRRCFMIYDEDNTRVLTFDNFYKYITNFLIPISRNDAKALFKLYDKKNIGEINYDSLINSLLAKFSESRRNLVNNAFNKLDEGRKGVLNMSVIRGGFIPSGHPDVINGKKTEQEVLAEFLDNFDYHFNLLNQGRNPDDEEVTNQEFIDFYRYISSGIEDDNYFSKMIIGVWGLNNQSNNSRRYY